MFLVLQLGVDGHDDLAEVDPGHYALGLSKGTPHTCLEPSLGTAWGQAWMSTGKACLQGPLGQPTWAKGCIHYQGGCCLWSLPVGLPWGKEHGWLNWLQSNITFIFMVYLPFVLLITPCFSFQMQIISSHFWIPFQILLNWGLVYCVLTCPFLPSGSQSDSLKGSEGFLGCAKESLLWCWELRCGNCPASGWSLPPSLISSHMQMFSDMCYYKRKGNGLTEIEVMGQDKL